MRSDFKYPSDNQISEKVSDSVGFGYGICHIHSTHMPTHCHTSVIQLWQSPLTDWDQLTIYTAHVTHKNSSFTRFIPLKF